MDSREKILSNLRLSNIDKRAILISDIRDSHIYKDYPTEEELLQTFKARLIALEGELCLVESLAEAAVFIKEIIQSQRNKTCLIQNVPLARRICNENKDLNKYLAQDLSMNSQLLAEYEIAVTVADYLIARTGSILLNSISAGGRRLSILPPIHIVVAEKKQIVKSLEDIFTKINSKASYSTIITGPSRTADIEKQLVLGAHGPKRLIVVLLQNI
jgi:L-lactate dehydrogenase complex protein LldG